MERVLEPELMENMEQAEAYAKADFKEPHNRVIELLDVEFKYPEITGRILDLGCGPGDITFRIAYRFPEAFITAVDGSAAMIELANQRKERERIRQIEFIQGFIPEARIPQVTYDLIICTSFLHHLSDPSILWSTIAEYASSDTKIFVYDLFRPCSKEEATRLVNLYSGNEPDILKKDFYNSLLAAFEPEEVNQQLTATNLANLKLKVISDRHIIVFGTKI